MITELEYLILSKIIIKQEPCNDKNLFYESKLAFFFTPKTIPVTLTKEYTNTTYR